MRKAAREFAPCGNAFGLNQALALFGELSRHLIERPGERAHFVARMNRDTRVPVSGRNFPRACHKRADWPRDAYGGPPTEQNSERQRNAADKQSQTSNAAFEQNQIVARTADKQRAEKIFVRAEQRKQMEDFIAGGIARPVNRRRDFAGHLKFTGHERRETIRLRYGTIRGSQVLRRKIRIEIDVKQRAHSRRQTEGRQKGFVEPLASGGVKIRASD